MHAVTVSPDAITSTAGLIWHGDRADLILTQTIDEPILPVGRRIVAETVVSDVHVAAIDQRMVEGAVNGGPSPNTRTASLAGRPGRDPPRPIDQAASAPPVTIFAGLLPSAKPSRAALL